MIKTISLAQLILSPRNVRRSIDVDADRQLKADIEARGLLQNLVVSPMSRPRGRFAVEAGGRRLAALNQLADEGGIAKDHEVCCLVIASGAAAAHEASLAENFQRLSMNPADECLAFQQLIDQGADVEAVARRFGLTIRFVEGRLRLATLAPEIFEALGAGDISLDIAKAYAATPDRERQSYVFEQMSRGYGAAYPDSIRRMMTQATASAGDRRARLVGEEAYVSAGGRIERDLFADDDAARWLDIAILERLACEKMNALAVEAATDAGLAWVRPTLDQWIGTALTEDLRPVPVETVRLTDEEKTILEALDQEIDELALGLEDEALSDDQRDAGDAAVRALRDKVEAIIDKPPVIDDALKAGYGAFLILDSEGRPRLDPTFYVQLTAESALDEGVDASGALVPPEATPDRPGGLSQRLVDELAIQRRDILAVHVAADPGLALDLAIFLMVDRATGFASDKSGSSLTAAPPPDPVGGFETPAAAATLTSLEADQSLDRSWTEGATRAVRFDAFRLLCEQARAAWLGQAVARTLTASLNLAGEQSCAFHDHLGILLGIDVARWWRPTGSNYFDRVPKRVTLAALAEIGGAAFADRYATAKKAELAQSCERIFAGDFIGELEIKQAALDWLPPVMRFAAGANDPVAAGPAPWEDDIDPGDAFPGDRGSEPIEQAA